MVVKFRVPSLDPAALARWMARHSLTLWLLLFPLRCAALAAESTTDPNMVTSGVELDPTKVMGPDSCTKCHGQELQVWQQSRHCQTFETLHRQPQAQQIADRMGIRSIKRGGLCIQCHYTPQGNPSKPKPIAGVSCEMCHGAAKDWIAIHNDYGGPNQTKATETTKHRSSRLEHSIRLGMRNPVNVYLIARSCFNCHTVPHEPLVNRGGHTAGSAEFELVSWSQGRLRHNFLRTNSTHNAVSSAERLRVMYVVGLMTDLEYSLRATALATATDVYGFTVARRTYTVRRRLADLQGRLKHPAIETALGAAYGVQLKSNNGEALPAAAHAVGTATYQFAEEADGTALSIIDSELPSPDSWK